MNLTLEQITKAVLEIYSGPYYVAGTETQRKRVLEEAVKTLKLGSGSV
jgi:hypothetical protein